MRREAAVRVLLMPLCEVRSNARRYALFRRRNSCAKSQRSSAPNRVSPPDGGWWYGPRALSDIPRDGKAPPHFWAGGRKIAQNKRVATGIIIRQDHACAERNAGTIRVDKLRQTSCTPVHGRPGGRNRSRGKACSRRRHRPGTRALVAIAVTGSRTPPRSLHVPSECRKPATSCSRIRLLLPAARSHSYRSNIGNSLSRAMCWTGRLSCAPNRSAACGRPCARGFPARGNQSATTVSRKSRGISEENSLPSCCRRSAAEEMPGSDATPAR